MFNIAAAASAVLWVVVACCWFMSLALTAYGADSVRVARLPDGPLQVVERA